MPFFQNSEFIWNIEAVNYRPFAPFLYEVASHVKNCHFGDYDNIINPACVVLRVLCYVCCVTCVVLRVLLVQVTL